MSPSDVMGALIEVESAYDRPRALARALGIDDEGAIDLIRRAIAAEVHAACEECIHNEEDY